MAERGRKTKASGHKSVVKHDSKSDAKEKTGRPHRGKKSNSISGMDVGQDGRGIPLQGFRHFYE